MEKPKDTFVDLSVNNRDSDLVNAANGNPSAFRLLCECEQWILWLIEHVESMETRNNEVFTLETREPVSVKITAAVNLRQSIMRRFYETQHEDGVEE